MQKNTTPFLGADSDEDLLNHITVEDVENILYEQAKTSEGRKELISALRTFDKEAITEPIIQTVLVSMAADHGEDTYDLIVNDSNSSINGEEMFHENQRVLGNLNAVKSYGSEPGSVAKARATIRSSSNSPTAAHNAEKSAIQAASQHTDTYDGTTATVPQMGSGGGDLIIDGGNTKDAGSYGENEKERNAREALAAVEFGDDIRVLLINAVDMRIICHFLSCQSVNDIKNAPYNNVPMIGLMLMECLVNFMRSKGYSFSGEIDFDQEGNPIPTTKQTWILLDEEHTFTRKGYIFFKHESGERKENVVFYNFSNLSEGQSGLTAFSNTPLKSKKLISELEIYTKQNNCIRGTKLRDVDMIHAKFEEVAGLEGYSFEKYYYQQYIRDIFDMEVFGFLNNIDEYNSLGIDKRGVMTYGPPGCVLGDTKIRVRKKTEEGKHELFVVK